MSFTRLGPTGYPRIIEELTLMVSEMKRKPKWYLRLEEQYLEKQRMSEETTVTIDLATVPRETMLAYVRQAEALQGWEPPLIPENWPDAIPQNTLPSGEEGATGL
jgi:hypothetical protein